MKVIINGQGEVTSLEEFQKEIDKKNLEVREKNADFNLNNPDGIKFYVISIEDSSLDKPRYWRADAKGYTYDINEAGIYSYKDLAASNLREDIVIPVSAIKHLKYLK